jgi:lipopolysaccharide/colanic/teichoic acid biosynthesis glycosyltransferase
MNFTALTSLFRRRTGEPKLPPNMLDESTLKRVIRRERDRSNRTDRQFLLLFFSFPHDSCNKRSLRAFCDLLSRRLRSTDVYGYWGNKQVATVLPETPRDVAETVGKEVCDRFSERQGIHLTFKVHVHPFNELEGLDDHDDSRTRPNARGTIGAPVDAADSPCTDVTSVSPLMIHRSPIWKRAIDIVGATVGLILSAPILAAAALAIRLDSKGSVIFKQKRSGLGGKPFVIYKLRTMSLDAESKKNKLRAPSEQDGPAFKIKNDPRITGIGNLLRKTSIDELPQLWNVLKNDMSLVGPRPLPCDEADACETWQKMRLDVKPGITCIWQVFGRSAVTFVEWMRMDLRYIRYYNLSIDLKLIWKTVITVIKRKGAC